MHKGLISGLEGSFSSSLIIYELNFQSDCWVWVMCIVYDTQRNTPHRVFVWHLMGGGGGGDSCHVHGFSSPIRCRMKARWEAMKITVGSEEARLLGKACKCFSRNPAQVNDLNGAVSSTFVWQKSSIPQLLNVDSKSLVNACASLKLNIYTFLFAHASVHI